MSTENQENTTSQSRGLQIGDYSMFYFYTNELNNSICYMSLKLDLIREISNSAF